MDNNGITETDPLDALFIDNKPLDTALLAKIILPYIKLYGSTHEVVTNTAWEGLPQHKKILVYLLGLKALRAKGFIEESEEALSPGRLEELTKIKGNSLRPTLSRLLSMHLVRADNDGKGYYVPDHALPQIDELVSRQGD